MITLERTSVMNLENAIRGARNPMNSWGRMDSFYDDDDAFEYISENLIKLYGGNDQTAMRICALVDDYMDLQESYMEQAGLVEWE